MSAKEFVQTFKPFKSFVLEMETRTDQKEGLLSMSGPSSVG